MATDRELDRLVARHRASQLRLRNQALREAMRLWAILNPDDLLPTSRVWVNQMVDLILDYRRRSGTLAFRHYGEYRGAALEGELGPASRLPEIGRTRGLQGLILPDRLPDPPRDKIVTSLSVTGPVEIERNLRKGDTPSAAKRKAQKKSLGSTGRLVLEGGREATTEAIEKDSAAVGWARVTQPNPCAFCALMASRGPIYKSEGTAGRNADPRFDGDGKHKWHDNCGCSAIPVFKRGARYTGSEIADRWDRLYAESTVGERDKLNAFRAAYEGRATPRERRAAERDRQRRELGLTG